MRGPPGTGSRRRAWGRREPDTARPGCRPRSLDEGLEAGPSPPSPTPRPQPAHGAPSRRRGHTREHTSLQAGVELGAFWTPEEFARLLDEAGRREIAKLRWGLVPSWAKNQGMGVRLINARAETVHTKRSYGAALRSRRCLVPANGWFEWQRTGHGKQPYFLALADGLAVTFAALWERWEQGADSLESFTIITRAATPALADIHHRQPAVIGPDRFDDWLDLSSPVPELLDLVVNPLTAQTLWRGLVVAPEVRCAPYDADAYRYPQSSESRIFPSVPFIVSSPPPSLPRMSRARSIAAD